MHHFPLALVLGCALSGWCTPVVASAPDPAPSALIAGSVDLALATANGYIDAGRPSDAITLLRPLMAAHADDRRVVLAIARAYRRLADTGQAIDVLAAFVHAHAGDTEALLALAEAHAANRDYASSEADVRAALAVAPHDPAALTALGESLALQRRDAEAREAYDSALRADPQAAQAFAGRAWLEAAAGDDDHAATDYRRALAIHPDDVEALDGLARLELARGRPYAARRLAERAAHIAQSDVDSRDVLAIATMQMRPRIAPFVLLSSAADAHLVDDGVAVWLGSLGGAQAIVRFDQLRVGDDANFARFTRATASVAFDLGDHLTTRVTMESTTARSYAGLEVSGRWRRLFVRAGTSSAPIDAAAAASDDRIYPAAAFLRTAATTLDASTRLGSIDLSGSALVRSYGDGNRFSENGATLAHRFGGDPYTPLSVVAGVRDGGFAMNRSWYALPDSGYYDYLRRRDQWLGVAISYAPPRAAARGGLELDVGERQLTNIGGTIHATFDRVAPYVDLGTDAMRVRASAYRARYAGPAPYRGYESARLDVLAEVRL